MAPPTSAPGDPRPTPTAAQGPGGSFEAFFRAEHHRLVAIAVMLTNDPPRAEDLAQEALLRAYRDWERVAAYDQPGAWVRRVLLNLVASAGRSSQRERRALARVPEPVPTPQPGPVERADVAAFWAAVRALPRRQAEAVALFYVEDLTVAEVAAALGCRPGTVKSHLARGRAALATSLRTFTREELP